MAVPLGIRRTALDLIAQILGLLIHDVYTAMELTQLKVSFLSSLSFNTLDSERRRSIQLYDHHTLLNLGDLLSGHTEAKGCCKWYLLTLKSGYAFERLSDVSLH